MKIMIADRRGKEYTLYDSSLFPMVERLKASTAYKDIDESTLYEEALLKLRGQYEQLSNELDMYLKEGQYIALVDMGLWNGRHDGYRLFKSPHDIISVFSCDETTVTFDQYNVRAEIQHHDGTHYVLFRRFKEGTSQNVQDVFQRLVYSGLCTGEDIKRHTVSLRPEIAMLPSVDLKIKTEKGGVRYVHPL